VSTSPNELARTVKTLPAIAGLADMWAQRTADGETHLDHCALLEWLDKGSRRPAPAAGAAVLAARYQWAERAAAYDKAWELARECEAGGLTPEQLTVENLTAVVQLESKKLLQSSARDVGSVLTPKDLLAIIGVLKDLQLSSIKAQRQVVDLSKYTDAELKIMRQANEIARSKANK
jgi:hypothetical protein